MIEGVKKTTHIMEVASLLCDKCPICRTYSRSLQTNNNPSKEFECAFLQGRYTNGQKAHESILIFSYHRNVNQKVKDIPTTRIDKKFLKDRK
jgi:hypothetical protein